MFSFFVGLTGYSSPTIPGQCPVTSVRFSVAMHTEDCSWRVIVTFLLPYLVDKLSSPQGYFGKLKANLEFTAELILYGSPDDSYFPKSGGSTFLKTVSSYFF